jgi:hypothetical protein
VIAHATYNLLRVFDWYCAKLTWHPETLSGETGLVGLLASSFAVLCFVCAAYLVLQADAGTQTVPAPGSR